MGIEKHMYALFSTHYPSSGGVNQPMSLDRFRLLDKYGKHTRKQFTEFRSSLDPLYVAHPTVPGFVQAMLSFVMKFPFLGIPQAYLAHAKDASDFRGRLFELQERWDAYTRQLIREYSDFILAVSLSTFWPATDSNINFGATVYCAALVRKILRHSGDYTKVLIIRTALLWVF